MSASSNNPEKYYRTGIAIPVAKKAIFDERMALIGIKTVGELVSIILNADGVVEALKPVVEAHFKSLEAKMAVTPRRKSLLDQIKLMPTDALDRLYAEFATQGTKE